jgi:hypothetical protein
MASKMFAASNSWSLMTIYFPLCPILDILGLSNTNARADYISYSTLYSTAKDSIKRERAIYFFDVSGMKFRIILLPTIFLTI